MTLRVGPRSATAEWPEGYYAAMAWPGHNVGRATIDRRDIRWDGPFATQQEATEAATIYDGARQ